MPVLSGILLMRKKLFLTAITGLLLSSSAVFCLMVKPAYAVDGLANLVDMVNTIKILATSTHIISFTLPTNSLPIYNTDFIHIYFESFTDITPPTLINGYYTGIPVISTDGQWVHITGITVLPGAYIAIHGITTTNPAVYADYQTSVLVTEDAARTIRKNGASTYATLFRGHVAVTATLLPPFAQLQITGYTAPYTFIVFTESNAVIGTDVAGPTGYFSQIFSGLEPTIHHVTFYGIDQQNRTTSPINIELYTPAHLRTTVSDQLLSPTNELNTSQFLQTDTIIASGSAIPGGNITIFTDTPLRTYYATAAADGSWQTSIANTNEYVYGDYRLYSLAQNNTGLQSLISNALSFSIVSNYAGGTSCGDITQGDLNCDGNIDLTDFSIIMYYWAGSNAAADINADGMVNLTDFSIMMYFWGT
jgi:hypothetical protein